MFNLEEISQNLLSQLAFIVLVIMGFRGLVAYTREDWGAFFSSAILGVLLLVVIRFGPQIEQFARWAGSSIFG